MEIDEKFERLYDFVRKKKKFPPFDSEYQFTSNWIGKKKKRWVYKFSMWISSNYERNFQRWNRFQVAKKLEDKSEISEFLQKAINYQRMNFIFPIRARWFNENSEAIFMYLEQHCNEHFD